MAPLELDVLVRLGVALADAPVERDHVALSDDGGIVTPAGEEYFLGFCFNVHETGPSRRSFCRPCLDWSERRIHLAGAVGAALATCCFELDWISRMRDTRAVHVTDKGKRGFSETFGIELSASGLPRVSSGPIPAVLSVRARSSEIAHPSALETLGDTVQ